MQLAAIHITSTKITEPNPLLVHHQRICLAVPPTVVNRTSKRKMALTNKSCGYQCEFVVQPINEDFLCKICKYAAREPHITDCCGETFCLVCITPFVEEHKPCPSCGREEIEIFLNVKYRQRILSLRVWCTMKDRGCIWVSKLAGLEGHMDTTTGDCPYVDIECPNECGKTIQRRELKTHMSEDCHHREFLCQYCHLKASYRVVTSEHWQECKRYPIPCPNECGASEIERGRLEAHLNEECPLQEVFCDFGYVGCTDKVLRKDLDQHMEENVKKHLAIVSSSYVRLKKESQQRMQQQQEQFIGSLQHKQLEFEGKLMENVEQIKVKEETSQQELQKTSHHFERRIREKERQIEVVQEQLQKREKQMSDLQDQLDQKGSRIELLEKQLMSAVCLPILSMSDFSQHKEMNDEWFSAPVYTHPRGYKFCIQVWSYGSGEGKGSHVTVNLWSMRGEFDDRLTWPASCTITLQLLNQAANQDHVTVTKAFEWSKPTSQWEKLYVGEFSFKFIGHKELETTAQVRYIDDDRVLFRVTEVELK